MSDILVAAVVDGGGGVNNTFGKLMNVVEFGDCGGSGSCSGSDDGG